MGSPPGGLWLEPVLHMMSESPPPTIVVYHDPVTGAGWSVDELLDPERTHPYAYDSEAGMLRDAVQRYLADGIERMTGPPPGPAPARGWVTIINSADLQSQPGNRIILVLYPDAPASLREDPVVQAALGRAGGAAPDYVADRESHYIRTDPQGRTWLIANRVDGLMDACATLLESVDYDILGLGPDWIHAPDYRDRPLVFNLDGGFRNDGYLLRRTGGFGCDGVGTLAIGFRDQLDPPDEDVTRSYARWRIGTRMYSASSVPLLTGHGLDSYTDTVLEHMRHTRLDDGLLSATTRFGAQDERPPADEAHEDWLWIDPDGNQAWYCHNPDGVAWIWTECAPQAIPFHIDVSTDWVRKIVLQAMKDQSNNDFWDHPDDWSVFATDPADGLFTGFAERVHHADWYKNWYSDWRAEQGLPGQWDPYVLHGHRGIDQPDEEWDEEAVSVSDQVFVFANWLLREYDKWVDNLDEGPPPEPDLGPHDPINQTKLTKTGKDRRALIRSGLSSYGDRDVPPHFNLDPRVRIAIAHFAVNRGNRDWLMLLTRAEIAEAMAKMVPEPVANYVNLADWGRGVVDDDHHVVADPKTTFHVLPHQWGNSARSILGLFENLVGSQRVRFTAAGVRSWHDEMAWMGYTHHALGFYLMGKYLRDPTLDEARLNEIRNTWLKRAFGPGADAVRAYLDFTEPHVGLTSARRSTAIDVPNYWGRAIELLDEADKTIPPDTIWQRRLDDLKLHWYFYWLMHTDQLVKTNERTQELMWKGQSSFTLSTYLIAYDVFEDRYADLQHIMEDVAASGGTDYTAGPAHYTEEETTNWWSIVRAHWPYTKVDVGTSAELEIGELVRVVETQEIAVDTWDSLAYDAWNTPYVQAYQVIGVDGGEVGFTLLWKNDPADPGGYSSPHNTSWRIDRFDTATHAWAAFDTGYDASTPVAAEDNYTRELCWLVAVRRAAPEPGTYRITIGYGGQGQLAGPGWSIDNEPVNLPAWARLAFSERLILDGYGQEIWFYVPKARTHIDLEIIEPLAYPGAAQKLVLYSDGTPSRTVDVSARGLHTIALGAGEAGNPVRFDPPPQGAGGLNVPYFYGLPPIWARSPAALLVPKAVAATDGLTIIS